MRKITQLLLILFFVCYTPLIIAQEKEQKKEDSYYLQGAVPEINGKVVFSKEYSIPGMSQHEIYDRVQNWMTARLKENNNQSRILYTNKEKGQIVGLGEEWIVFHSSAISLDRTEIKYQLNVSCQPEKCLLEIEKIRFEYREGEEKYTAEEWITDENALNKSKTKMIRGLAKWRRKTVDFADTMGENLATALSASKITAVQETTPKETERNTHIVIAPKKTTVPVATAPTQPQRPIQSADGYKDISPNQLETNLIQMGTGKLVLVIGTDEFNMTTMTANAGGSLGKMSGKPVIFCFLSPDQPYEAVEKAESYIVKFYPSGQNTPTVILECKKLPSQAPLEGQPRMYIGEIIKAKII